MGSPWEVRFSNSHKRPYFYNASTSQSVWDTPEGMTDEEVLALPGAAKYLAGGGGGSTEHEGQVRASHILCKHAGSRRPSSWKEANITRPVSAARDIIQAHLTHLQSLPANEVPAEFAKIASTESDCSSAKKGGDLGWFGKGMMQKVFEDATYSLKVGEISSIVESDSGVHIILRTG